MSNQVRFSHGTKFSDSTAKTFNGNSSHTNTKPDLARNRAELCFNMHGKATIVDYAEFVKLFLPTVKGDKATHTNIFKKIPKPNGKPDMYRELPKAINDAKICLGFKVVATPCQADRTESSKQAVDMGLYRTAKTPKREKDKAYPAVDWFDLDLLMECKADETEQDAFDENQPNGEPTGDKRRDALGQAYSYIELIVKRQHRMFVFMLFFLGNSVRIARFDRSGVFVTRKFDYKVEDELLVDFLHRYSQLSDAERGYDPTASRILPNTPLYKAMRRRANAKNEEDPHDYARALFQKLLNPHWPWWKVEVHAHEPRGKTRNQHNHTVVRKFAVGMPHFQAPGVAGRGTCGYVALPVRDDDTIANDADFVYLKDAWWVDHDSIDLEGVTLRFLNKKGVEHVPTLLCHGDLPGQVTRTQEHCQAAFHPDKLKVPLKQHHHYRLVVKEVGLPLEEFKDGSWELCDAIFCCLIAHAQAYKAGIIHRDISAGNMLLYKDKKGTWCGLLNDWELSKKIDFSSSEGRQPGRTGTWQYMSANALNNPCRRIVIQDELESFFHVLLYYAVRFLPHNLDDKHVGQFLHDYFDAYCPHVGGYYHCGRTKLDAMRSGAIHIMSYHDTLDVANSNLKFLWPSPREPPSSNPKPIDGSSSPALPSSPSPAERALPPADSPSSPVPRPASPTSSAIFGSDLTSLPSDPVQPPQELKDREHPLNTIIKHLLSWFQAHYALDSARTHTLPKGSQNNTQPAVAGPTRKTRQLNKKFQAEDVLGGRDHSLDVAQTLQYERLRVKLQSHNAMLTLFYELLNHREWPEHDKGRDKKTKDGYAPPKPAVPMTSTATGSKRRSMDEEPEARPGASKRSRA